MTNNLNFEFIFRIFKILRSIFPFSPQQGGRPTLAFGSKRKNAHIRSLNLQQNKPKGQVNIAVICSQGLGDALIMHIASHNLVKAGFKVVTFSDHLGGFGPWLPGYSFAKQPSLATIPEVFKSFDAIILQHDNSQKAIAIKRLNIKNFGFYGSHKPEKHGPLTPFDYVCNPTLCMVDNVVLALTQWFNLSSKKNGLTPPPNLIHKKYPKRVVIHPSSSDPCRNWPLKRYERIASALKDKGYDPVFISKDDAPLFTSLEDLSSFIYESGSFIGTDSGPGHLASNLNIPCTILGTSYHHLRLWRPGWHPPQVITPPKWSSRFKWTRKHWKSFIPTTIVIKNIINSKLN